MRRSLLSTVAACLLFGSHAAEAATASATFNVTITIVAQCVLNSASNMAFGSTGILSAAINQSSSFAVTCTNSTPYTIALDGGLNVSGSQRRMKGGASNTEFISYNLFSDAARSVVWGPGTTATVSGTGSGVAQNYSVYGQVPAQTTPSPATNYTDTVTIAVTY